MFEVLTGFVEGIRKIRVNFEDTEKFGYRIVLKMGTPEQLVDASIDQKNNYTIISLLNFNSIASETKRYGKKIYAPFEGQVLYEKIKFEDDSKIVLNSFPFYQTNNSIIKGVSSDALGLSFQFENESFSFIHSLKKEKYIDNLVYTLSETTKNKGILYFGGCNKDELTLKKYKGSCDIYENEWKCQLRKITINERSMLLSRPVFFLSSKREISVPMIFIYYLNNTYFKEEIKNGGCYYSSNLYNKVNFFCKCKVVETLPSISFTIGNYVYTFSSRDLFNFYDRNYCGFIINKSEDNKWTFGTSFLKKFTAVFDYKGEISFYSNTIPITRRESTSEAKIFRIICAICTLTLAQIFIFIYMKLKKFY